MSIGNFICKDCEKYTCCKWVDILRKFDNDAKNPLPIDIRVIECKEFKGVF